MKSQTQTHFLNQISETEDQCPTAHGGVEARGRRKVKRPIVVGRPLHVVFKSTRARGKFGFKTPQNFTLIEQTLKSQARRHFVSLMSYVIMGNHLHLKAKCKRRVDLQNFLRRVGSIVAQRLTGASPGKPYGRFWNDLVFSRVLTTRFEELTLGRYFEANRIEALYGYAAREDFLLRTRRYWKKGRKLSKFAFV